MTKEIHMHTTIARSKSFLEFLALVTCVTAIAWSSSARADGSSVPYGHGGMRFPEMNGIIAQYNRTGELFRIEGQCRSSCTELLAIKHVCIDPNATLLFHAALRSSDEPVNPAKNMQMASHYNSRLRSFVLGNH